jgi:hypothetical protein
MSEDDLPAGPRRLWEEYRPVNFTIDEWEDVARVNALADVSIEQLYVLYRH